MERPEGHAQPEQHPSESEEEAFVVDGEALDGEVLDDLVGEGMREDASSEEGGEGDEGPSASGADHPMHEDDSLQDFEGHADAVLAVAWSPSHDDVVATGGVDDRAFLWRVGQDAYEETAGTLSTYELSGHTDSVVAVAFNSTGTLLATGSLDATVRIWSTSDGKLLQTLEGPGEGLEWVVWHPKGDVLLAGSEDFSMWMWLAQSGNCMQVFTGHSGPVSAGAFTPDGKTVVSCGGEGDCSLRCWNPKTGECTSSLQGHPFHTDGITCLGLHRDGALAITGAQDGSVRVSNISSNRVVASPEGHEDSVEAAGFSSQQPLAATAGVDGLLMVWDTHTFMARGTCRHEQPVTRLAWHPQQPLVVSCCLDGGVRLWDLRTAECVQTWWGHTAGVQDVGISRDGRFVLSGGDDNTARVFQLAQS